MTGINKYDGKLKREQRRRNHIARDLKSDKYHQRAVPNIDKKRQTIDNSNEEDYFFVEVYLEDE